MTWNLNAREFTPLNVKAPEFVPTGSFVPAQIGALIAESGLGGILVDSIPNRYFEKFGIPLDLTSLAFGDLSTLVYSLSEAGMVAIVSKNDIGTKYPKDLAQAMVMAGFTPLAVEEAAEVVETKAENPATVEIGFLADSIVVDQDLTLFVEDLSLFKNGIVQVVYNFCLKNGALGASSKPSGLALSLFAAEWDRFHMVRDDGVCSLKQLRDKFGAAKLMPFLQAIPELDVVGIHPEVRVRVRSTHAPPGFVASPKNLYHSPDISTNDENSSFAATRPPSTGPRNISLSSELFPSATQTRVVLEQLMGETQTQILALLSHVPLDPLAAAQTVEKINQLQVLINALKAALAVMPIETDDLNVSTSTTGRQKISLSSMLSFPDEPPRVSPPPTPLSAAAAAGENVGPLLADLSRILFTQVLQQQKSHIAPQEMVADTNAQLERTLADIVSAASSPPTSPNNISSVGSGRLIIPRSLPTSPILMAAPNSNQSTPQTMRETLNLSNALREPDAMEQLLRGMMAPPGLPSRKSDVAEKIYGKELLLNIRKSMDLVSVPKELAGLSCKQAAPRVRV